MAVPLWWGERSSCELGSIRTRLRIAVRTASFGTSHGTTIQLAFWSSARLWTLHPVAAILLFLIDNVHLLGREHLTELLVILLAHIQDSSALRKVINHPLLYLLVGQFLAFLRTLWALLLTNGVQFLVICVIGFSELCSLLLIKLKDLHIVLGLL